MSENENGTDPRIAAIHEVIAKTLTRHERRYFDVSRVDADTALRSLPLDSITMIELIDHLNTRFGTALQPDDVYRATTVGDLVELIPGSIR